MKTTTDLNDVLDVLANTGADTSWMTPERACLGEDPELFFPLGESQAFAEQIREAKQVCVGCPVRTQCMRYGMDQTDGIFGGLTAGERRAMRAAAKRTAMQQSKQSEEDSEEHFPARLYNTGEARRLFRELVEKLRRQGRIKIATRDFPAEFYANVRSRTWALDELHRLASTRVLARTTQPGVFLFHEPQVLAS